MRKTSILFFLYLMFCSGCFATTLETFAPEFGKMDLADDFERYEKDTTAEAVCMLDRGDTFFRRTEQGFDLVFHRIQRIKILKKAGMDYATFTIPFYVDGNEMEEIETIKGYTYNPKGGYYDKTPLDIKTVYEEDVNKHWKLKKLTMPNVKEGSVVELVYVLSSPYFFNFKNWEFQKKIPVIYSEYVTHMIPYYSYKFLLQGRSKFDGYHNEADNTERSFFNNTFRDMVYTFVMRDLPAFKNESFITCEDDYMVKLDFQLNELTNLDGTRRSYIESWNKLSNELLDNPYLGGYLDNAQSNAKKMFASMNILEKTPLEKAKAIDQYMKSNYKWDSNNNMFTDKSVKKFLETKTGNSAEINLYFVALLKSAGLDAFPVLLSTRNHGKIKTDYPFAHFFNFIVAGASVEGKVLLFDATEPLNSMCMIPERCINDNGLILKKVKPKEAVNWILLNSTQKSTVTYVLDIKPNATSDSLLARINQVSDGYFATDLRREYNSDPDEFKKSLIPSDFTLVDTINVKNVLDADKHLSFKYSIRSNLHKFENKIAIAPFCHFPVSMNPLRQQTRTFPMDFIYKQAKNFQAVVYIPEGYKVSHVPASFVMDNEDVKIELQSEKLGDASVKVTGCYDFKKEIYPADSYKKIQEYFNTITRFFNDDIILEKI